MMYERERPHLQPLPPSSMQHFTQEQRTGGPGAWFMVAPDRRLAGDLVHSAGVL